MKDAQGSDGAARVPDAGGDIAERVLWTVALTMIDGIGGVNYRKLTDNIGNPKSVFDTAARSPKTIGSVPGLGGNILTELKKGPDLKGARQLIAKAGAVGARPVLLGDAEYPSLLTGLRDRPPVIWVKGGLEPSDIRAVAIVGTRAVSHYGCRMAERLAGDLALAGVTVVSGGAYGVDTEAHEAALANGGRTIVVLGNGIDRIYPKDNAELFKRAACNGAVITDYIPGIPPDRGNFPGRNRIISGMCWATCVVEAGKTSGALITAKYALEQGRDVFAVPHLADQSKGQGCNNLIKQGAGLVESAADILEALNFTTAIVKPAKDAKPAEPVELTEIESKIIAGLDAEPRHIDEVVHNCDMKSHVVLAHLYEMEIKGVVRALPGQLYVSTLEDKWQRV